MDRLPNFDYHLTLFAREMVGKEFVWGETDCGSLVRGAMKAMYGQDMFPHAPNWKSAAEAKKYCKNPDAGMDILVGVLARPVARNYEQPGDILLSPGADAAGLPRFAVILTAGQALVSTPEFGVQVGGHWTTMFPENTNIFRMPHE